jgi:hypothetical protein
LKKEISTGDCKLGTVWKSGRTTLATSGEYSHIKHDLTMPEVGMTSEVIIVGSPKGRAFSDKGDSGAAVWEAESGDMVGLVWGGNSYTNVSYVTPISEILDDVRKQSEGWELELAPNF